MMGFGAALPGSIGGSVGVMQRRGLAIIRTETYAKRFFVSQESRSDMDFRDFDC